MMVSLWLISGGMKILIQYFCQFSCKFYKEEHFQRAVDAYFAIFTDIHCINYFKDINASKNLRTTCLVVGSHHNTFGLMNVNVHVLSCSL